MSSLESLKGCENKNDLARLLGFSPSNLAWIVFCLGDEQKYTVFSIPKSGGGQREIAAPTPALKLLQRHLANLLSECRSELEKANQRPALAHAFRSGCSILSNAKRHKRRKFVFNIDLKDFFPSFNFGRVRGFFLKNSAFQLREGVATMIAQIACYQNKLPQGSPCSPIVAELITGQLDLNLAQFAKKNKVTYSRYADDITFSTSQRDFPAEVASLCDSVWTPGNKLVKLIARAGFAVNEKKTRMQYRNSKQTVTGLTVNTKVNIDSAYYRKLRSMCHSVFSTGTFNYGKLEAAIGYTLKAPSLSALQGRLSFVFWVKETISKVAGAPIDSTSAIWRLYARFLKYKSFVALKKPLIVCEGKTDITYLKCAMKALGKLGSSSSDGQFISDVKFFQFDTKLHRILEMNAGTSGLAYFFNKPKKPPSYYGDLQSFLHRPLRFPVIVLIDNDKGADGIFKQVSNQWGLKVDLSSTLPFYHVTDNLYLVKTPESESGDGSSCIEDCFPPSLLQEEHNGNKFNLSKKHKADGEYGKHLFAEKIVVAKFSEIDFSGFENLLSRLEAVCADYAYKLQATGSDLPPGSF